MGECIIIRAHQVKMDPRVRMEATTLKNEGFDVRILFWNTKNEEHPRELNGIHLTEIKYSRLMKLIGYESLNFHFWWKAATKVLRKDLKSENPILHCMDFPTLPICVNLKKKMKKARIIYDAADIWEYMVSGEIPSLLLNYHIKMEENLLKQVDFLITPGEKYTEYYISKGFPEEKTGEIMNAKRMYTHEYTPTNNEKPVILYIGSLKENRKIRELMKVIGDFPGVKLRIGGFGPLEEFVRRQAEKHENVDFLGKVPYEKVMEHTFNSDIIYVMFDNTHPLTRIGFPNKFFEATATGRAILTSEGTYIGELTRKLNLGIVVSPDEMGIRTALERITSDRSILRKMGSNAFEWGLKKYSWEHEEKNLVVYYRNLMR